MKTQVTIPFVEKSTDVVVSVQSPYNYDYICGFFLLPSYIVCQAENVLFIQTPRVGTYRVSEEYVRTFRW